MYVSFNADRVHNRWYIQRIIIVAVLISVGVERVRRVQGVDDVGLVDLRLREVVVVGQGGDHIADLPVANPVHCSLACVQMARDYIKPSLRDGIALGERAAVAEFLGIKRQGA